MREEISIDAPFTDDAARDRYAANGGNWADEQGEASVPARPTHSSSMLLWVAIASFSLGVAVSRL